MRINQKILNYEIVSKITEGGMGKIYRARHTSLDRLVVVKQLHSQFTDDKHFKERFLNEAQILASLNHQNIITVYDFIEIDNEFMIIMEYVDGDTIDEMIEKQGGGFHHARAIHIFKQILSGFSYAHSEGIVHRDIKPSNVILKHNDIPKILDFGIARMVQKDFRITKAGTKMGSLLYMSPEQILGMDVDSRSDIYSLGLLLFEMLSGALPYNIVNNTDYEIMECILKEEIKDINALIPGLPYGIGNILRKACAKNASERFQTCNEFITALDKGTAPPIKNEVYQRITTKNSSQNKTTYQSPGGQYIETQRKNSTGIIIGMASFLIIIIFILIYVLSKETDITDKPKTDGKESPPLKPYYGNIKLDGSYTGTIKDGTSWVLNIRGFDGKNFYGDNTIYWSFVKNSDGLYSTFDGTFDSSKGEIIMYEDRTGKRTGKFVGKISEDGKSIYGTWERYSDKGSYTWDLKKNN